MKKDYLKGIDAKFSLLLARMNEDAFENKLRLKEAKIDNLITIIFTVFGILVASFALAIQFSKAWFLWLLPIYFVCVIIALVVWCYDLLNEISVKRKEIERKDNTFYSKKPANVSKNKYAIMNRIGIETQQTAIFSFAHDLIGLIYILGSFIIPIFGVIIFLYISQLNLNPVAGNNSTKIAEFMFISGLWSASILFQVIALVLSNNLLLFKKEIQTEFLSHTAYVKTFAIYLIAIPALVNSSNPYLMAIGTGLLILYYSYIMNYFTAVFSGKIEKGGFW